MCSDLLVLHTVDYATIVSVSVCVCVLCLTIERSYFVHITITLCFCLQRILTTIVRSQAWPAQRRRDWARPA